MNLTNLEKTILVASKAFWNYGDENEKFDNAVCFSVKELATETGLPMNTIKGVVGSLFKKDLLCEMEGGQFFENVEIGITDDGIDAACAVS